MDLDFFDGVRIERDGDTLIVRGETTSRRKWSGAGVAVLGILQVLVFGLQLRDAVTQGVLIGHKLSPDSWTAVWLPC